MNQIESTSSATSSTIEEGNSLFSNGSSPLSKAESSVRKSANGGELNGESRTTESDTSESTGLNRNWIKLNVGGKQFMTTRSTLCRYPRSFLAVLCQEDSQFHSDKDEHGAFLIDRDPTYFAAILNFLRHGKLILNSDISEEAILEEAEFYNLPELVQLCQTRINNRHKEKEHVYRVFNFSEMELPQVISNISDGWKINQIVCYRSFSDNPMFICIMYKEFLKREHQEYPDYGRPMSHIDSRYQKYT